MKMIKLHEMYCETVGPGPATTVHGLCTKDAKAVIDWWKACNNGGTEVRSIGNSPDVHGGERVKVAIGPGLFRPMHCVCGAPMRYRISQEVPVPPTHDYQGHGVMQSSDGKIHVGH